MLDHMRRSFREALVAMLHSSVQNGLAYLLDFAHGTASLIIFCRKFCINSVYASISAVVRGDSGIGACRSASLNFSRFRSFHALRLIFGCARFRVGCGLISARERTIDSILVWKFSLRVFRLDILT